MRRIFLPSVLVLTSLVVLLSSSDLRVQEDPGDEVTIRPGQIRDAILDYIRWDKKLEGVYSLFWDDDERQEFET